MLILRIGVKEGILELGKVEVVLIGVMIMDWSSVERHTSKIIRSDLGLIAQNFMSVSLG